MTVVDEPLYYYRQRKGGITNSRDTAPKRYDYFTADKGKFLYAKAQGYRIYSDLTFSKFVLRTAERIARGGSDSKEKKHYIAKLLQEPLFLQHFPLKKYGRRDALRRFLLLHFPTCSSTYRRASVRGCTKRKSARENYLNKIILLSAKHIQVPIHYHCRPRKSRSMEGQRGYRHGPARLLPPRPAVQNLPSPPKKVAFTQPDASPVRGNIAPESPFGLLAATCLSRCRHMLMSLWRHAYVAKVRCLCRQSDIGFSPAPHQKRPVYRCLGCPFFVLFGHFRHEMRILAGCNKK
jgi:hypothetical protein